MARYGPLLTPETDIIEKMFNVTLGRDVETERKILESLPRDQLVEQLLHAHVRRFFDIPPCP